MSKLYYHIFNKIVEEDNKYYIDVFLKLYCDTITDLGILIDEFIKKNKVDCACVSYILSEFEHPLRCEYYPVRIEGHRISFLKKWCAVYPKIARYFLDAISAKLQDLNFILIGRKYEYCDGEPFDLIAFPQVIKKIEPRKYFLFFKECMLDRIKFTRRELDLLLNLMNDVANMRDMATLAYVATYEELDELNWQWNKLGIVMPKNIIDYVRVNQKNQMYASDNILIEIFMKKYPNKAHDLFRVSLEDFFEGKIDLLEGVLLRENFEVPRELSFNCGKKGLRFLNFYISTKQKLLSKKISQKFMTIGDIERIKKIIDNMRDEYYHLYYSPNMAGFEIAEFSFDSYVER